MKKWMIVPVLIMLCCMSACCKENVNNESEATDNDYSVEEMEVDAINRTIIAEALGVEENNRNIRFILSSLNTINAGRIKSAEVAGVEGEKVINLVAEDGTDYRIYLSGSGSVEAVENLTTGEWAIQSER